MSGAISIEVEDLTHRYQRTEALRGISFRVAPGEIIGLLGPNGAGKSTTIKILAGILPPTSGRAHIGEFSLPQQSQEAKRVTGYVPESMGLFESLSALEYLQLVGRLREMEEDPLARRIETLLDVFDLARQRFHRLATYSKGMRQKVLLAAALLHNPDVLLLDEPLTGLDVNSSLLIKDLLYGLAREGKTILYSSHVLDVVEKVCDRVLILHQGRLIADGPMDSLRETAQGASLEEIFRQLTSAAGTESSVARILAAIKP